MRKLLVVVQAVVLLLTLGVQGDALAKKKQPRFIRETSDPRLGIKGMFGFGGDQTWIDRDETFEPTTRGFGASMGGVVFYEYPLIKYFHLGVHVGFNTWTTEKPGSAEGDEFPLSYFIDGTLNAKIRYPFFKDQLEAYIQGGGGVAGSILDSEVKDDMKLDHSVGWNAGVYGGASYHYGHIGLLVEMGWTGHAAKHSYSNASSELEISVQQFALNIGLMYVW